MCRFLGNSACREQRGAAEVCRGEGTSTDRGRATADAREGPGRVVREELSGAVLNEPRRRLPEIPISFVTTAPTVNTWWYNSETEFPMAWRVSGPLYEHHSAEVSDPSVLRQGNELLSPGTSSNRPLFPILLGLFDSSVGSRSEIPTDVPRPLPGPPRKIRVLSLCC